MRRLNFKKYQTITLTVILVLIAHISAIACEACNQNQPKILRNITHGSGPQSNWDYFIAITMVLIVIYSLYASIKCFVKPSEKQYSDIKNIILKQQ